MDMLVLGSKLQFTILYKNLTILGTGVYGTERKCTSLFSCSILHSVNFFRFFYTIKDLKHVHCALQLVPMKIFRTPPVRFLHRVPSVRIMWRQRIFSFRVTAISKKENLFFFFLNDPLPRCPTYSCLGISLKHLDAHDRPPSHATSACGLRLCHSFSLKWRYSLIRGSLEKRLVRVSELQDRAQAKLAYNTCIWLQLSRKATFICQRFCWIARWPRENVDPWFGVHTAAK